MSGDTELRAKPTVEAAKRLIAEAQLAEVQEQLADRKPMVEKAFEPAPGTPLWASILVGTLGSLSPAALTMLPMPWGALVAIVTGGIAIGLSTHFGIKSAGVAKTPSK